MSFWPSIRDLSRIRLDPNLLQNQFVLTQDVQSWDAMEYVVIGGQLSPKTLFQAFHNLWISYGDSEVTTHILLDSKTKTKETDSLTFRKKDVQNRSVGLYFCLHVVRGCEVGVVLCCGVSDTWRHVSHVSPWVTTSPLPSTHVGVRDMWETTSIYGSQ